MGPPALHGLSEDTNVIVKPESRQGTKSQTRKPIVTRDKRYNSVSSFGRFLMDVPWESVLDVMDPAIKSSLLWQVLSMFL